MFLFLNPQLTNSTRGMRPVPFEVAARVVSVNSVRLDVCFVGNPTGAALKPVTSELWLEGAKWKCWTERRSSTPPVSARNSSKTIACVRWWHHRGRGLSKDSLGVSESFSVSWSTRTRIDLYQGLIWASFSVTPLEVSYDEQSSTSDARRSSSSEVSRRVEDSFYQLRVINRSSIFCG